MASIYETVGRLVDSNDKFVVTAHETPDGDAIGSEVAFYHALRSLHKECMILNADPMPHYYEFLNTGSIVKTVDDYDPDISLKDHVLVILDTNDINNIGEIRDIVLPQVKRHLIIDHHHLNREDDENCIVEEASSTCEILFDIFSELGIEITPIMANALFVGIVYDTGSFIYPKTSAKTFFIAYQLVSKGVNPNFTYQKIYESNSISSLVLQSKVLASLELEYGERVAIQTMSKETIAECGASYEESASFINLPLKSENIVVSIFFKENTKGVLRCSIRSKGDINVAEIAQSFGGGGHKTAAGFKCKKSASETRALVLQRLKKYFT